MNILFVCTGNTCRSPMAAAIMKAKKLDYHVLSAGLAAQEGMLMNELAQKTIQTHGLSEDHRSQLVTPELMTWAHYIFTMTATHKVMLEIAYPTHIDKIFTLKEFTKDALNISVDVADPYGSSLEVYEATFEELERFINEAISKIDKLS